MRVACGSLAGPCGSLPGAGKDLPARTGERRREETGKADREAHLVKREGGEATGKPGSFSRAALERGVNSPELKYLGTDILIKYEYLGAPRMVKR